MSHETTDQDRPNHDTAGPDSSSNAKVSLNGGGSAASDGVSGPARTILYDLHRELAGKMVDFAGWEMPVQYPSGIMNEHKHCREQAALFDVSHMGQLELRGPRVAQMLETLVPADIVNLPAGHARYTFFTNDSGGILDDLIVSHSGDHLYMVVNASMRAQDVAHLRKHLQGCTITELNDHALIALQGPKAAQIVSSHCPGAADLKFMQSVCTSFDGVPCRASRLGYTGEDGYELSVPAVHAQAVAHTLLAHENCKPAGLGARDSLRLEAGLCLYGSDIDASTSPVEASLSWSIQKRRREEGGFPGYAIIARQIADGALKKLVGIRPSGRTPARHGAKVCDASGSEVGVVTSGGFSPTLGCAHCHGLCRCSPCAKRYRSDVIHPWQAASCFGQCDAFCATRLLSLSGK